ncbi:hypothetical protein ACJW30_05G036800 [Castanea mollissima]
MANDIQTKLGCNAFFFIALLCMLRAKIVDGENMYSMENLELVPRKGTVKTIEVITTKLLQSESGDIVDCVDIYQQPTLNDPALKNHVIEMQPPFIPKPKFFKPGNFQTWRKNGDCPKGTVPLIRNTKGHYKLIMEEEPDEGHYKGEDEYAQITSSDGQYYGFDATLNSWNPNVTFSGEYSTSQVWISSLGPPDKASTLVAGWQQAGNKRCLNTACGFVQVSKEIVLGLSLVPLSIYNGKQSDVYISFMKFPTSPWWLVFQNEAVGYWPVDIFKEFADYAPRINFGGKIYNSKPNCTHTTTQMGSGHFPSEGLGKACYIKSIRYFNEKRIFMETNASTFKPLVTKPACYDLNFGKDNNETSIFFGGPGYSDTCRV